MKDLSDLNENQILRSIIDVVENGDYQETEYGVWFHGHHISPARVITRAYELHGEPIDRSEIRTNTAQKRLLELGFPIQKMDADFFFTKNDLVSFSELVKRKNYDKSNQIDKNIGQWLNNVAWEKCNIWKKDLMKKGWDARGAKNWNTQSRSSSGQGLKNYTWYRIYPKERASDLICFTIGIHSDPYLVYKLDCKRDDPFFKGEKWDQFENLRKETGSEWQYIDLDDLKNMNWDELFMITHKYFQSQLPTYHKMEKEILREYDRRIMRLTWNESNWEKPSGHKWSKSNQRNTSIAYENQYGYGHEEWLFNHRYKKDGYQYGYVRGVEKMSEDAEVIDELVLYSINPNNKERYLVAEIRDVTIIEGTEEVDEIVIPLVAKYYDEALEELEAVNADTKLYKKYDLVHNIKFTWDNVTIFNNPIPAPFLKGPEFNRFQAYRIDKDLSNKLDKEIDESFDLLFVSGKASTSDSYDKKTTAGKTRVVRSHSQITNDLYDYLHKVKGIQKNNLSAEKTRVGGAIVDLAMKDTGGDLTLFEAKTSSSGLSNIRQALGQLFEYAFLDESAKIKELVIVGPTELKEHEVDYMNRIRAMLKVPLNYWAYMKENKLEERFLES